jgi:hypothetical protein
MTLRSAQFLRILGVAALLFIVVGQTLHATEILFAPDEAGECHHEHSDAAPGDCPAGHSCCHLHVTGIAFVTDKISGLPEVSCRIHQFSIGEDLAPDGCLREIDYPPQLS